MAKLEPTDDAGKAGQVGPFTSLLAVSSLILALLLVAGFSYRWTYYYNFGLKDLALEIPLQSLAISALELIRNPSNALFTFSVVVVPLVALNVLLTLVEGGTRLQNKTLASAVAWTRHGLGLDNRLVTDALRAAVLIYAAYWAGSQSGWEKYRVHITESDTNPLPVVTAIMASGSPAITLPFTCKAADWDKGDAASEPLPPLIGNPATLRALRSGLACDTKGNRRWRLLLRTDRFVYLFATGRGLARPPTIVLPNSNSFILVMGGNNASAR